MKNLSLHRLMMLSLLSSKCKSGINSGSQSLSVTLWPKRCPRTPFPWIKREIEFPAKIERIRVILGREWQWMNISMETVDSLDITFSVANMNLLGQKLLLESYKFKSRDLFEMSESWKSMIHHVLIFNQ